MMPVVMLKVDVYFGWNAVSREVARPDVIRLCTLHADWKVALSCGFELFPISCMMYGSSGLFEGYNGHRGRPGIRCRLQPPDFFDHRFCL